jgi:hypothetical protein
MHPGLVRGFVGMRRNLPVLRGIAKLGGQEPAGRINALPR